MTAGRRPARAASLFVLLAALSACGDDTPAPPPAEAVTPIAFDYLPKLRLAVARITIEDERAPGSAGLAHVESLSPVPPFDALAQLARDRLGAGGNSGQARFVIEDASIVQGPGRLDGAFAVRLDVETSGGTRSGYVEARVVRSQAGGQADPDGGRGAAYRLVKAMLDDMNVELEYRIRHSLRDYLQTGGTEAPGGSGVRSEDLPPPPGVKLEPPPTAPGS